LKLILKIKFSKCFLLSLESTRFWLVYQPEFNFLHFILLRQWFSNLAILWGKIFF